MMLSVSQPITQPAFLQHAMSIVTKPIGRSQRAKVLQIEAQKAALDLERLQLDTAKFEFEKAKLTIDLLSKEYKNRFDEVIFHSSRYHKQSNFIQLYIAISGSILAMLFSQQWLDFASTVSTETANAIKAAVISIAYIISLYLFTNILDALYSLYMNGRQLADLERRMNAIELRANAATDPNTLRWDSQIIPRLYSADKFFIGAWIRPNILIGVWSFLFFIAITVGLCVLALFITEKFFYYFAPVSLFFTALTIMNWLLLHGDGIKFIDASIQNATHSSKSISMLYLIAMGNVFVGYLPMLLFSVRDKAFCGGILDFTFCKMPTVWFGDLFLLPLFAYYAIRFLQAVPFARTGLVISLSVAFAVILSSWLHLQWVSDRWLGFMDIKAGELSEAGVVHFVYFTINFSVVLMFVLAIVRLLLDKKKEISAETFKLANQGLQTLLAFTVLGVVDWLIKVQTIFKVSLVDGLSTEWPPFAPPLLFALLLWLLRAKVKDSSPLVKRVES